MNKKHFLFLAIFLFLLPPATAQRITVTVGGSGYSGYSGDGWSARMAKLNHIKYICTNSNQDVFFSDQNRTCVRKISGKTGVITTVVGGGSMPLTDGMPATNTSCIVNGIASDDVGNLYIAADRIWKIDAVTNIVTTIAGGGTSFAEHAPAANAYLTALGEICRDKYGNINFIYGGRIRRFSPATNTVYTIGGVLSGGSTTDGVPATSAQLYSPAYITTDDSANVYFGAVFPGGTKRIRKISYTSGILSTPIGAYPLSSSSPIFNCRGLDVLVGSLSGLCCDRTGAVVFNEYSCSCRNWQPQTDSVYPVAGNYFVESFENDTTSGVAYMNYNTGVTADNEDSYYIVDSINNRIRKVLLLKAKPSFAFGKGQFIASCPGGYPHRLDSLLWVADLDSGQSETWSVISSPSHGTVSGFPYTKTSSGIHETTKPKDLFYTSFPSYAGQDSFLVKVSDGTLTDTLTIFVSVQAPPAISISGPDEVCEGQSIPLVPSLAGGTWQTSNTNATIDQNGKLSGTLISIDGGSVTALYRLNFGCIVTASKTIAIKPSPDAAIIIGVDTICVGDTALFSSVYTPGWWSVFDTTKARMIDNFMGKCIGLAPGLTTIRYSVTLDCGTGGTTKSIYVKSCEEVGIGATPQKFSRNFMLYPNPASQTLFINSMTTVSAPLYVKVSNLLGQIVLETDITLYQQKNYQMDVSKIPAGMYIVTLHSENGITTYPFAIER